MPSLCCPLLNKGTWNEVMSQNGYWYATKVLENVDCDKTQIMAVLWCLHIFDSIVTGITRNPWFHSISPNYFDCVQGLRRENVFSLDSEANGYSYEWNLSSTDTMLFSLFQTFFELTKQTLL